MPKPIETKRVVRILQEKGFFFVSQKGSHAKFRPHGTFRSILRQSKLMEGDFRK